MEEIEKIVDFRWCTKCKYFELDETKEPCAECLDYASNTYSRRPVNFKAKDDKELTLE